MSLWLLFNVRIKRKTIKIFKIVIGLYLERKLKGDLSYAIYFEPLFNAVSFTKIWVKVAKKSVCFNFNNYYFLAGS